MPHRPSVSSSASSGVRDCPNLKRRRFTTCTLSAWEPCALGGRYTGEDLPQIVHGTDWNRRHREFPHTRFQSYAPQQSCRIRGLDLLRSYFTPVRDSHIGLRYPNPRLLKRFCINVRHQHVSRHQDSIHSFTRFSLSALLITDTELKLIAAAAIIGDNNTPKTDTATLPPPAHPVRYRRKQRTGFAGCCAW